jgi:hypothetical protein
MLEGSRQGPASAATAAVSKTTAVFVVFVVVAQPGKQLRLEA